MWCFIFNQFFIFDKQVFYQFPFVNFIVLLLTQGFFNSFYSHEISKKNIASNVIRVILDEYKGNQSYKEN